MKMSFREPKESETNVKYLLRKHNIYHLVEPYRIGNWVHFRVEASVENINAYQQDYEPISIQYKQEQEAKFLKLGFWYRLGKLLKWIKHLRQYLN